MPRIEIDHDEAGNGTGDDADSGLGPTGEPGVHLVHVGAPVLKFFPAYQRALVTSPDRDD